MTWLALRWYQHWPVVDQWLLQYCGAISEYCDPAVMELQREAVWLWVG